jgi:hypothetical protein
MQQATIKSLSLLLLIAGLFLEKPCVYKEVHQSIQQCGQYKKLKSANICREKLYTYAQQLVKTSGATQDVV